MSEYAYTYDPTGMEESNKVTNEVKPLSEVNNAWNCIIPLFAPFFRGSLIVKHVETNRELKEGLDFYLGHFYKDGSTANKNQIFGSIMLLDNALAGSIRFEQYQSLGGRYTILRSVAERYLAKVPLKNPRNCDWDEVMITPLPLDAIAAPTNRDEAISTDLPTGASDRIRVQLENLVALQSTQFDDLIDKLFSLSVRIQQEQIADHEGTRGVHKVTTAQLNATGKDAAAADAINAYGRTLTELVSLIHDISANAQKTNDLFDRDGDSIAGVITFTKMGVIIKNNTGTASINDDKTFTIKANGSVLLHADFSGNNTGLANSLRAGDNELTVHSNTGTAALNHHFLIDEDSVADYIPPPSNDDSMLHVRSSDSVALFGRGIAASPLSGEATVPTATSGGVGLFRLNHGIVSTSKIIAASITSLNNLWKVVQAYLDDTVKINGKLVSSNPSVSKSDIGLGSAANTTLDEKNVSAPFTAGVANKSPVNHTHSPSDFKNPPIASGSEFGIAKLSNTLNSQTDVLITPKGLGPVYDRFIDVSSEISKVMPGMVFDIKQYGGFGYLPIPVAGDYGAPGNGSTQVVAEIESNGDLVVLRVGSGLSGVGVYYWYAKFDIDGNVFKAVSTTTRYQPPFFDADEVATGLYRGQDGAFVCLTSKSRYWIILTRGTMDSSKHVGAVLSSVTEGIVSGSTTVFIQGEFVHFHYALLGNYGCYSRHWTVPLSEVEGSDSVSPTPVLLSGLNFIGAQLNDEAVFKFANTTGSTDPAANPLILITGERKWGVSSYRHSTQNMMTVLEGDKLRVFIPGLTYMTRAGADTYRNIGHSYVMDISAKTLTSDMQGAFPFILDGDSMVRSDGLDTTTGGFPDFTPNGSALPVVTKGRWFIFNADYASLKEFNKGNSVASFFENAKYGTGGWSTIRSIGTVVGRFGSIVETNIRYVGFVDGSRIIHSQDNGRYIQAVYDVNGKFLEGDKGWGPTTARSYIDTGIFGLYMRTPMDWRAGRNQGFVLTASWKSAPCEMYNDAVVKNISWDSAVIEDLKVQCDAVLSTADESLFDTSYVSLHGFGKYGTSGFKCFVMRAAGYCIDSSKVTKRMFLSYSECDITVVNDRVTSITLGTTIYNVNVGYVNLSAETARAQSSCISIDGGTIFMFGVGSYYSVVGNGYSIGFRAHYDENGVYIAGERNFIYAHTATGYYSHPTLGAFSIKAGYGSQALMADVFSVDLATLKSPSVQFTCILHATNVSEGWNVYFTDEARYYVNSVDLTIPPTSFDLSNIGLSAYVNTTIYVYATAIADEEGNLTAQYLLSATKIVEDDLTLFIGIIKTTATGIDLLDINNATRLGDIYELVQHNANKRAHGDLFDFNKESVGLSNIENMAMKHDLSFDPEDNSDYYASAEMVRLLSEEQSSKFQMVQGIVAPPAAAPVPNGFTKEDCDVLYTINHLDQGGNASSITGYSIVGDMDKTAITVNREGTVTSTSPTPDGTLHTLKYTLLAIKA